MKREELDIEDIKLLLSILRENQSYNVVMKSGYFLSKRYNDLEKLEKKLKRMVI